MQVRQKQEESGVAVRISAGLAFQLPPSLRLLKLKNLWKISNNSHQGTDQTNVHACKYFVNNAMDFLIINRGDGIIFIHLMIENN
jgi:hypothetical protein